MEHLPSITTELGTVIAVDPDDPLVRRRAEISRAHLREALRRLPAEQRTALRLAARDGRDLPDIARTLDLSPLEADALLQGGLRRLRALLLEQLEDVHDD